MINNPLCYEVWSFVLSYKHGDAEEIVQYVQGFQTTLGLGYYSYRLPGSNTDDRFVLIHLPSNCHFGFCLFSEEQARQMIERIAPLTDWTRSQDAVKAEIGFFGKVREILWNITAGDFEDIPSDEGLEQEPVCETLNDLLCLAQDELKITRDQIIGEIFFEIGDGDCVIIVNGSRILLWNRNFVLQSFDEADWQVYGVELVELTQAVR